MRRMLTTVLMLFPLALPALEKSPAPEFHARRHALAEKLSGGAALLFAAEEPVLDFSPYRQDEDFYYLTGWNEPGAALLIEADSPAEGTLPAHPYREILFLPMRNLRVEKYTGRKLDAATPGAAEAANVDEIRPMTELTAELAAIGKGDETHNFSGRLHHLYTQLDMPAPKAAFELAAATLSRGDTLPAEDVRALTTQLREIKSASEIALLTKASDVSMAAHRAVFQAVHPGVSENHIDGLFYGKIRDGGAERVSYTSIVGSGPNSTTLHYAKNDRVMKDGDLLLIDAAAEYSMYASDITRTMPVNGHFTPRQREIYSIVLGAQQAAAAAFVSGKYTIGNPGQRGPADMTMDRVAYDYINTHGKDLHGEPLGKYFIHGVGHGVGIDVHDPTEYKKPLGPGSVFTIEPGIYIPEENIGVRIEDVFWVDESGKLRDFCADLPHTAEDVEAAMKR